MLTIQDIKKLRGIGNTLEIRYQLGKQGFTDTALKMFENALVAHELIKIDIMRSVIDPPASFVPIIEDKLHAEVVEIKGKTLLIYRRNPKNPKIKL